MKAIPYIIITILTLLLFQQCQDRNAYKQTIYTLNDSIKNYQLKNGKLVSSIETLTLDKAMAVDLILSKDRELTEMYDKFSEVKTITKTVFKTKIDTLKIAYKDSVPCVFNRSGTISQKWYNLSYKSNQKGIEIENLAIPDSIKIITGTKRKWLFGKETQTIDILHDNPFIKTESIQHIEIKTKTTFYQSTIFKILFGAVGGYYLSK